MSRPADQRQRPCQLRRHRRTDRWTSRVSSFRHADRRRLQVLLLETPNVETTRFASVHSEL